MKEMRVQVNMRVNKDVNISTTFTHLIEEDADIAALGEADSNAVIEYALGYARGGKTE